MKQCVVSVAVLGLATSVAFAGSETSASRPVPAVDHRCDAYGPGYFAIKGSDACVGVGGYIGADAVFASAPRATAPPVLKRSGLGSGVGVSGEIIFDTPLGPGKITVGTRRSLGQAWLSNNQ